MQHGRHSRIHLTGIAGSVDHRCHRHFATVIADFIHEGLGHGGMCVATGGQPLVLSTVHFECSADTRLVAAGGTLANLIFGALFWVAARAVKRSATWRYFFWLLMTFNLFDAGGYFLFSGIGNIGDWAAVVAGWQPAWAWRVGLAALGIVDLFLFVCASVLARIASVLREGCENPCAARASAHGHALSHCRGPRLRRRRAESGGAAVDSDLRRSCVIWWQLRAGMDVEPAPWPAHPQQRIPDARNRTQPGMDHCRSRSGDRVHRGTGTGREVSFASTVAAAEFTDSGQRVRLMSATGIVASTDACTIQLQIPPS